MKICITSSQIGCTKKSRLEYTISCVNTLKKGLIVFPGWALGSKRDLPKLESAIKKGNRVTAVIEVIIDRQRHGELFLLQNGRIQPMNSRQVFRSSGEINIDNAQKLLNELREHRQFEIDGKKCLLLLCGESSIIRCHKNGKPTIAVPSMQKEFEQLFSSVDIVINPMHTPWANIYRWVIMERAKYFSKNHRAFYGTSNSLENSNSLNGLKYVFVNGKSKSLRNAEEDGDDKFNYLTFESDDIKENL